MTRLRCARAVVAKHDSAGEPRVISTLHDWLSTKFSEWRAMVSKLRRGVLGSRARSELKEFWQTRSRLMGERSGRANSVQSRMCGRGGAAGDVAIISGGAAWEVQAGGRCQIGRVVYRLFDVEWGGRQKSSKLGS